MIGQPILGRFITVPSFLQVWIPGASHCVHWSPKALEADRCQSVFLVFFRSWHDILLLEIFQPASLCQIDSKSLVLAVIRPECGYLKLNSAFQKTWLIIVNLIVFSHLCCLGYLNQTLVHFPPRCGLFFADLVSLLFQVNSRVVHLQCEHDPTSI